jgi:hypothetical protein
MLQRVEIPKLTDAVVRAEVKGKSSYDVTTTGAADAVREAGTSTKAAARKTTAATKRTARKGPRRRSGRGSDQGRRRLRERPGNPPLRRAHRRRDQHEADRALADRPGQDRRRLRHMSAFGGEESC